MEGGIFGRVGNAFHVSPVLAVQNEEEEKPTW